MTKVKAIFLDIDGTLVSFETHKIPQSAIEALKQVRANGVKIFIATGRPTVFINNLGALEELDLIDGYVTMNGSYCYVGDEVVFQNPIPSEEVKVISEYCEKRGCACVFVGEHNAVVCNPSAIYEKMFYDVLFLDEIPTVSFEEAQSFEVYQMSPFIETAQETDIEENIANCEIGRWADQFADIGAKGNTKQLGVDKMIAHFGIKLEETMAFGDGGNDISMLKHAAIGVAMGNAGDNVKAAANYVTQHIDDDGLANALKHFNVI